MVVSLARLSEVLPPLNYPEAVIGDDPLGTVLQVPSGETLELKVQLGIRWQSPRLASVGFRRTGQLLMLGGAVVMPDPPRKESVWMSCRAHRLSG